MVSIGYLATVTNDAAFTFLHKMCVLYFCINETLKRDVVYIPLQEVYTFCGSLL